MFSGTEKEKLTAEESVTELRQNSSVGFSFKQEPQLIKLDQPGPLTLAMHQFVTEMQETKKGVVTPKELFAQVCKK